ncbi:hypothetical protein [Alicyclobacillus acidoterrestris]|uniref:ATP-binding protein n=1 Tax=Alicyclobacillus acidoterrestris (strain ATCC 49025 / DSM 3922 / CIP 106132 / NCIMB 13137 / GD3B) TaxID=1356854 RepID=A0A9E6ZPV9_ALIAG|nr:hypothetical protein [Alicyclobacillus acidoterrestris]UNO48260.1 hypothetical protein K1I37_16510 [Alicyclobacillus acidoterrestris]
MEHGHTDVIELMLEKHNMFALDVSDSREDTVPLSDILSVLEDFRDDDRAVVAYCFEPYDRVAWSDRVDNAYKEWNTSREPKRANLKGRMQPMQVLEWINDGMYGLHALVTGVGDSKDEAKKKDEERNKKPENKAVRNMNRVELTPATRGKKAQPTFKTWARIYVSSKSANRRKVLSRAFSNAYAVLNGDNRLIGNQGNKSAIDELNAFTLRRPTAFAMDVNLLSSSEVGKLIQLPTAQIQEKYAEQLDIIGQREVDIVERLTDSKGLYFGDVTYKGRTAQIYFPIGNLDELCLPHIVICGMGQGKTRGFGANMVTEFMAKGFSCFAIDVAKDEIYKEVSTWAAANGKSDKVVHVEFGQKPVGLDWCEISGSSQATNRFASEVLAFFERQGADPGLETKRYIRLAAKTVAATGGNRLADVVKLFTDESYLSDSMERLKQVGRGDLADDWIPFTKLSQGMKGKVLEPVLNRLDLLLGDDYLAQCIRTPNGLDLRKWINGGYGVICYVPKDELGEEATDTICAILIAKIWLATLWRKNRVKETPCGFVMDEPHQFLSSAAHWKSMVVESRKYRLKLCWLFHSWEQIPRDLAEIIKSAGPHYSLYPSSKKTFKDLAEEISPFTVDEALKIPTHHAINIWRSGGQVVPPFLAKMSLPPSEKKSTSQNA